MRRFALGFWILAILPGQVGAQEWHRLDGAGVRAALEGRSLMYVSGAWQDFRASGATLYKAGSDSWGHWRVQDGMYCSQWPPSDLWACYAIERSGDKIRFLDVDGGVTEGTYAN